MSGIQRIAEERARQQAEEGWSPSHDDRHTGEQLAQAAVCYATPPWARHDVPVKLDIYGQGYESCAVRDAEFFLPETWPWSPTDWRPGRSGGYQDRLRELAKAGALIAAEMDRIERRLGQQ